jgi:hypothetical protein
MFLSMKTLLLAVSGLLVIGCGSNCRETVRLAAFEASQGNEARARKLYEQAWAMDSVACPEAKQKPKSVFGR